jgi:hypothetical protein
MNRAAAVDTGSTRNSCALAVIGRSRAGLWVPLALREWIPSAGAPLDLRLVVLPEAAAIARAWGCESWGADSFAPGETRIVSSEKGLAVSFVPSDPWEQWRHAFAVINRGQVTLAATGRSGMPNEETLARLRSQLATVRRSPGSQGKWQITLPEVEGAHGDLAVAFARALWHARAADAESGRGRGQVGSRPRGRSEYAGEIAPIRSM